MVAPTVIASEFLGSTKEERIAMCRKLAAQSEWRASTEANPLSQRAYLEMKRQWEALADELESSD